MLAAATVIATGGAIATAFALRPWEGPAPTPVSVGKREPEAKRSPPKPKPKPKIERTDRPDSIRMPNGDRLPREVRLPPGPGSDVEVVLHRCEGDDDCDERERCFM